MNIRSELYVPRVPGAARNVSWRLVSPPWGHRYSGSAWRVLTFNLLLWPGRPSRGVVSGGWAWLRVTRHGAGCCPGSCAEGGEVTAGCSCPVEGHRSSGEDRGCDGDQSDMPAGHAAHDDGVDRGWGLSGVRHRGGPRMRDSPRPVRCRTGRRGQQVRCRRLAGADGQPGHEGGGAADGVGGLHGGLPGRAGRGMLSSS
jgi:hypothetical protein